MRLDVVKCRRLVAAVSFILALTLLAPAAFSQSQSEDPAQEMLKPYLSAASKADSSVKTFSAEEGAKFFAAKRAHSESKEQRSCTSCHTANPANQGKTQVGKIIEPMARSANKERFTDQKKVEKWFKRNCQWVLERECTAREKGNFITFMLSK